jgi:hypothetical protein
MSKLPRGISHRLNVAGPLSLLTGGKGGRKKFFQHLKFPCWIRQTKICMASRHQREQVKSSRWWVGPDVSAKGGKEVMGVNRGSDWLARNFLKNTGILSCFRQRKGQRRHLPGNLRQWNPGSIIFPPPSFRWLKKHSENFADCRTLHPIRRV